MRSIWLALPKSQQRQPSHCPRCAPHDLRCVKYRCCSRGAAKGHPFLYMYKLLHQKPRWGLCAKNPKRMLACADLKAADASGLR
ncbi:MAG: hypothetical protein B0W54_10000 [Cellvibrio sp. 79]|nr:MAG: hypothetical protein B0W54_10000 [Cellvibrio sp. 79]